MRRAALRIAGIYALFGAAWILFSDRLIRLIAQPDEATWLQTGRGWLLVLGTALMIYLLVNRGLVSIDGLRTRHEESPAERRRVQRELSEKERIHQAARLESLGQLAGGISHDFNNVLSAILSYCELLLYQVDSASPLRQDVVEIQKAANRGAALAGQLLAFSRKRESLLSVMSLNDVVDELVDMLGRLLGRGVKLNTRLDPALGYVKADATQLGQVVMNLVVNARDAMPDGGTITIETANVELDEEYAAAHPSGKPGPHVMLAVSDTGFGMDEETQSRIFEPYFTTKGPGKGTGLGLSTVYTIVKDSGGNIWVYSTPAVGTTFRVYLPQVSEAGAPLVARKAPAELPGGRETVMVVDDEEGLRLLMSRVLERSGYSVLVAGDGQSALELAGGYEGPIHAMITDLMLPEMTGLDLAERLVGSRPEMKVLYISGHGDLDVVRPGAFKPGMAFLQKPFTPSALVGKLRHALDTSASDVDRALLDHSLA
ncbi:MAG: ATP-binding protein [Gemmatimonadales bacterium]|jgi:signal transduction histidine kinase/ActR/RegA family two-component response regulator